MYVLLTMCVFVCLVMAARAYRVYRPAWVVGQWLALAQASFIFTMPPAMP